jgi:hypothetical protein
MIAGVAGPYAGNLFDVNRQNSIRSATVIVRQRQRRALA